MRSSNKPSENKEKETHQNSNNNNLLMTNDESNQVGFDFPIFSWPQETGDDFLSSVPFDAIGELFPELLETNTLALEGVPPENELPLQDKNANKEVNLQEEGGAYYTASKRINIFGKSFNQGTTWTLNTWRRVIPDSDTFNNLIKDDTLIKNEGYKKPTSIQKRYKDLPEDEALEKIKRNAEQSVVYRKQLRKLDPEKVKQGHPLFQYLNKETTIENWKYIAKKLENGEKIYDLFLLSPENDNTTTNAKIINFKEEGRNHYKLTKNINIGGKSISKDTSMTLNTWSNKLIRQSIYDYITDGTLQKDETYQKKLTVWTKFKNQPTDEALKKTNERRDQKRTEQQKLQKLDPTKIGKDHPLYKYLTIDGGSASVSTWYKRARNAKVQYIKTLLIDIDSPGANSKEIGSHSIARNDDITLIEPAITNLDTISSINPSDDQMLKSSTEQLPDVSSNSLPNSTSKKRKYDESNETDTNIQNLGFPVYISERSSAPILFNGRSLDQQFSHPLTAEQFNFLSLQQPHSSSLQAHSILNTQKKNKTQQNPPDPSNKPFDGPTSS